MQIKGTKPALGAVARAADFGGCLPHERAGREWKRPVRKACESGVRVGENGFDSIDIETRFVAGRRIGNGERCGADERRVKLGQQRGIERGEEFAAGR